MKSTLILWDSTAEPSERDGLVYTWNGYTEKGPIRSLRQYVESRGEQLRQKYLGFIHDLGEVEIKGRQLKAHLDAGDDFSLWWMSLLAEKSFWKSPNIDAIIRLIALEEIVLQQKPDEFILASGDSSLHKILSDLCRDLNIAYEWKKVPDSSKRRISLGSFYRALPHSAQAIITLVRHIWGRWSLRKAEKSAWFEGSEALFFCSYFIQMIPNLANEGKYYSRYWGDLCGFMRKRGFSGNWLQHYYPHGAVPDPQVAVDWVKRFNQQRHEQGFHTFLDAYLSLGMILRVLKSWFGLLRVSLRVGEIEHAFRPHGSQLSLWPLMREDWHDSVSGAVAISNLLWIELFDKVLSDLPHQRKGFYLCENIAWERALIHAWRKHGHGQLIAVAYGVIRFWDLRYFNDLRTIQSSEPYALPQADLTVLNGKAAVDAFSSVGYPKESIAEGEALRNGYLHDLRANFSSKKVDGGKVKVLVLGDFSPSGTIKMLRLLEAAGPHICDYTVKPHPLYQIKSSDYPSLKLKVVMDPLEEILGNFDIAYSTNLTSAAVDAYLTGLQVVVMYNQMEPNLSPLRGQPGVRFVNTSEELAEALQAASSNKANGPEVNDFLFLDPELPRWSHLLAS